MYYMYANFLLASLQNVPTKKYPGSPSITIYQQKYNQGSRDIHPKMRTDATYLRATR